MKGQKFEDSDIAWDAKAITCENDTGCVKNIKKMSEHFTSF